MVTNTADRWLFGHWIDTPDDQLRSSIRYLTAKYTPGDDPTIDDTIGHMRRELAHRAAHDEGRPCAEPHKCKVWQPCDRFVPAAGGAFAWCDTCGGRADLHPDNPTGQALTARWRHPDLADMERAYGVEVRS